jgi:protein SCO1
MKNVFLQIAILFLIFSCNSEKKESKKEGMPYYHTPDFTPLWISEKAALDTLHHLANFSFLNQNGEKITQETFRGKIHVADFFFTICPSLCPRLTTSMKEIQRALKADKNVLLASYSVTPDRDSVAVLRKFATANNIIDGKWHLMTGDKKTIYQTARKSYFADENIGVQKGENDFLHTENFILVDKNLRIRGVYNGTLPLEIEHLIEDIRVLEKE